MMATHCPHRMAALSFNTVKKEGKHFETQAQVCMWETKRRVSVLRLESILKSSADSAQMTQDYMSQQKMLIFATQT